MVLLTAKISAKKSRMAKYIEVFSLVTSDKELVELVEVKPKKVEVIWLVTNEGDESDEKEINVDSTTDYNSDKEFGGEEKKIASLYYGSVMNGKCGR